jgi:peptidoglycan hydrolase-like protein with peptidoglycan-binding domain
VDAIEIVKAIMTIGKKLMQFAAYPVAMAATVGLCLWVLLGPLHIGQPAVYPLPELAAASTPEPIPAPANTTPEPVPIKASNPEPKLDLGMADVPGDRSASVTQVQSTLIKKGYSVGPAGADGNLSDNTLTALEAFQDDNALPVQPKCDQECRTALGFK